MADIDLKTETPDASINDSAVLFGADSQASASPSVYSVATVRSHFVGAGSVSIASGKTLTGSNTLTLAGTDATTMTFPATSGTVATLNTAQTFTALQTLNRSGEQLALGSAGSNSGVMSFAGSTSGKVTMQAAAAAGTYTLTLPTNDGDSGQFLQTDGSGVTSWATASGGSGSPGGSDTQIQYNNAGSFGGASGLTTDGTSLTLGTSSNLLWSTDLILTRRGAANLRLGAADVGSTTATVTITIATPGVVTWSSHNLSTGTPVFFTTTGALPTGITASTTYYVIAVDANTFRIATTLVNALAGTAVNTSGSQSGTQTGNRNAITQALSVQSVTGVSNRSGADMLITGSQGTGNAAGGSIVFQVAPAGSSGSAQNALASPLVLKANGDLYLQSVNASSGFFYGSSESGNSAGATIVMSGSGSSTALKLNDNGSIGFTSGFGSGTLDTILRRDAANTLALRNGTAAQTFNVYNTFTSSTNFERFRIFAQSAAAVLIGTEKGSGGGTARALELQTDGTTRLTIASTGAATFVGAIIGRAGSYGTPSYQFGSGGAYFASDTTDFVRFVSGAGATLFESDATRFRLASGSSFQISTDVILLRDAANTLALRNGTAAQESRVYGSFVSATNFQRLSVKTLREVSTALSGATYVSTIAIPAYAVLIGVTTRVNTAITGATTYDVGDGTDVDLWGAAIPIAINSESRTANFTAVAATGAAATSRTVTLTANGSNFTGGVVEICLHYLTTEAD